MAASRDDVLSRWHTWVNLSAAELSEWLGTEESWSVGDRSQGEESIGHAAGRRTVDLLDTPAHEWTEGDWRHVRRALGVIARHRAQWPDCDVEDTRWRWSLMNWGHDPLRDPSVGQASAR